MDSSVEVPSTKVCDLGDPFSRIAIQLATPEFRLAIASKDPQNVMYRTALAAVMRLGVLGGYDCIHDKVIEPKESK